MTGAKTFQVLFERPATGTRTAAVARDLSLGGMFIVTPSPPDDGTLLAVEIDLDGVKVSVDARVLRHESDGMAVVFLDLPEDVAATLTAAITPASGRTILGVGSANIKATTPGLAAPASEPRVPVAVPSVKKTTPGIAAPAEARRAEKRAPDASATTSEPKKAARSNERAKDDDAKPRAEAPSSVPPPPRKGSAGRWFFFLLLVGGGVAAYSYRDALRREIDAVLGTAPTSSLVPDAAPIDAGTPDTGALAAPIDAASATTATAAAAGSTAAAADSSDAATGEAGSHAAVGRDAGAGDAGHDAGAARDAGARDAGLRDSAHRDAGGPR